jgi:hypothetical protein
MEWQMSMPDHKLMVQQALWCIAMGVTFGVVAGVLLKIIG